MTESTSVPTPTLLVPQLVLPALPSTKSTSVPTPTLLVPRLALPKLSEIIPLPELPKLSEIIPLAELPELSEIPLGNLGLNTPIFTPNTPESFEWENFDTDILDTIDFEDYI
jgi:hypothetical protein